MKRSRTNFSLLLLFIICANIILVAPISVKSEDTLTSKLLDKLKVVHIIDITFESDDKDSLITYQSINQDWKMISDEYLRIYEITANNGFDEACKNTDCLISSTFSQESCNEENSTSLPSWKINKGTSGGKFRLKFNQANQLSERTLFLCVFDQISQKFEHMGNESRLHINGSKPHNIAKRENTLERMSIVGFRVESSDKSTEVDEGVPVIRAGTNAKIRLFGHGFTDETIIGLTAEKLNFGDSCRMMIPTGVFKLFREKNSTTNGLVDILLPEHSVELFFCAKNDDNVYYHQGSDSWMSLKSHEPLLPTWVQVCIILICLCFSALFSGLNLGLMSLDRTDLKILCNTGTESEKRYAHAIQPVRDHGNYLLCSILLGNVLVNSTFTILLDSLTSGLIAVVCSTLLIVIFGEITPQAICSRHGLAVGAKTILATKFIMLLTFPLSYPTSKLLDILLGEEIGTYYNRERLNELVKVTKDHNDLDKDEVNIISGVLEMRKKTVGDIMTPIEDAYMLPIDSILDFETISKIMNSGYSRIPVYDGDRKNILSLLYIKDLAFVDTDDSTPLRMLCEFYQNPCHFVFDDLTLDVMFKQFKEGNKGHMAFVHRVNNDGDGDPFYETIGLVTLEDVIEELIQAEIMDETDRITDNRTKNRRLRPQKQDFDFSIFVDKQKETQRIRISPQLTLAAFQFLSTTLDPFKRDCISENILRRLLNQDVVRHVKSKSKSDPSMIIFQQNKPVDFFVLILEGRVEVTVGRENLMFESGPFTHFGLQALIQNVGFDSPMQQPVVPSQVIGSLQSLNIDAMLRHTFTPDYSVRAITDVMYLSIKRSLYLAAKRATLMEQTRRMGENSNEPFDDEVEKLLYSLDEDDSNVHTNMNTPKMSKPASPLSVLPTSSHQINYDSEVDGLIRQNKAISNHNSSLRMPAPDPHGGPESEVEQPLLNKSSNL